MGQPRRSFTRSLSRKRTTGVGAVGRASVRWRGNWAFRNRHSIGGCGKSQPTPLGTKSFLATEELKVLRREVEQLRMERDISKKRGGLLRQGVRHEISLHSGGEGARSRGTLVSAPCCGPEWLLCVVPTPTSARARQNQWLMTHIGTGYRASRGRYGSPRIHRDLQAQGFRVAVIASRDRCGSMPSAVSAAAGSGEPARPPREAPAANILRREVVATRPNEKWAGEITYIPTRQGWLYVAVLMDLYSRRIIGWAMGEQMTTTLTLRALEMAVQQRPVPVGLLHHSDRGASMGRLPINNGWSPVASSAR